MTNLLTVLTVRTGSERFPGKVLASVNGEPLLSWLIKRAKRGLPGKLVVATTTEPGDNEVEVIARKTGTDCYRHIDPDDVVGRIMTVATPLSPSFIFRMLGDCPFLETTIVARAAGALQQAGADLFLWYSPPTIWPVYGAREFPYSIRAWALVDQGATGEEREHPDLFINRNRRLFDIIYHDPPPPVYYRSHQSVRLEVDYPEDLELVRAVAEEGPGMLASLPDIIRWLDTRPDITNLNRHRTERTGPAVSYSSELHRSWYRQMTDSPVINWDNELVHPLDQKRASQICCDGCGRLLGYGFNGLLHLRADGLEGAIGEGRITCPNCGTVRVWRRRL